MTARVIPKLVRDYCSEVFFHPCFVTFNHCKAYLRHFCMCCITLLLSFSQRKSFFSNVLDNVIVIIPFLKCPVQVCFDIKVYLLPSFLNFYWSLSIWWFFDSLNTTFASHHFCTSNMIPCTSVSISPPTVASAACSMTHHILNHCFPILSSTHVKRWGWKYK